MKFHGREAQQKKIRTLLRRSPMQIALVYGRRRVGKSELIKHCLTGLVSYACKVLQNLCDSELSKHVLRPCIHVLVGIDLLYHSVALAQVGKLHGRSNLYIGNLYGCSHACE